MPPSVVDRTTEKLERSVTTADGPEPLRVLDPWHAGRSRVGLREAAVALVGLLCLALAVYLPHVIRGGWYLDDWSLVFQMREAVEQDGFFGAVRVMYQINHRPGNAILFPPLYVIGRSGQAPYLLAGLLLTTGSAWLLYLAARAIGITRVIAVAIAAGYLVVPITDGARLWLAGFGNVAAVAFFLVGLLLAIRGLRSDGRAAIAWHAAACVLYAWAILTYELLAGIVVLAALVYVVVAGPRAAARRWPADLLVAAVTVAIIASRGAELRGARTDLGFLVDRVGQFPEPAWQAFRSLLPAPELLGGPVGLLLLLVGAFGMGLVAGRGDGGAWPIRKWLAIAGGGVAVIGAGYVMLLPADPYYVPRVSGLGNRISIVASAGMVIVLVALVVLVALGIAATISKPRLAVPLAFAGLAVVIANLAITEVRRQSPWAESWSHAQAVVGAVHQALGPDPDPGTRVVTFRHPTILLPGDVTVFYHSWDLRGALQVTYDDATLDAHPFVGLGRCTVRGFDPQDPTGHPLRYGDLWFIDAQRAVGVKIETRTECEQQLAVLSGP